jgi:hypothetical protein
LVPIASVSSWSLIPCSQYGLEENALHEFVFGGEPNVVYFNGVGLLGAADGKDD